MILNRLKYFFDIKYENKIPKTRQKIKKRKESKKNNNDAISQIRKDQRKDNSTEKIVSLIKTKKEFESEIYI